MQKTGMRFALICAFIASLAGAADAWATQQADVVTGLNTLSQLMIKIPGDTTMAVVYDPADIASTADAQRIKKIVDSGMTVPGGGKVTALFVGVNELGKLSRANVAFITPGLSKYLTDISTATSAASILTISTDIDCVRAAKCIIGVETVPTITIYYSKAASDSAKIEFTQAFTMLVKQP